MRTHLSSHTFQLRKYFIWHGRIFGWDSATLRLGNYLLKFWEVKSSNKCVYTCIKRLNKIIFTLSFTFIGQLFTRLLRISRMNRGSLGSSVWIINLALRALIIWVTRVFTSQVCIVSGHGQVFVLFIKYEWMNLRREPLIKAGACGDRQAESFYVTIP